MRDGEGWGWVNRTGGQRVLMTAVLISYYLLFDYPPISFKTYVEEVFVFHGAKDPNFGRSHEAQERPATPLQIAAALLDILENAGEALYSPTICKMIFSSNLTAH